MERLQKKNLARAGEFPSFPLILQGSSAILSTSSRTGSSSSEILSDSFRFSEAPQCALIKSGSLDAIYGHSLFPALCEMEAFGPRNRNSNHSFRNVLDIKERKRRSGVENVNESVRVTAPLLVFMLTKEIIPWLHFSPGVSLIPPFNSIPGGRFRMKRITSTHLKQTNTLTNKPMRFKRQ